MSEPVSLAEARLFLRVSHDAEDTLIATLLAAAKTRLESALNLTLTNASPAPLRLAVMALVAQGYTYRDTAADLETVEAWIAPYREVRL